MRWLLLVLSLAAGCGRWGFEPFEGEGGSSDAGDSLRTEIDGASTDSDGGTIVVTEPGEVAFSQLSVSAPPQARRSSGVALASERVWIYGGFTSTGTLSSVASFNPSTGEWAAVSPTPAPPVRERHALGWDPSNGVVVAFGGLSGLILFTYHDELYLYSPSANSWTEVPQTATWPEPRRDAAMVWMSDSNQFLLYGGSDGSGSAARFSDLWLLSIEASGPSATWTKLSPGGVAAPAQSATCVGYDPVGKRLILHGGESQDGQSAGGTYQYLVGENVWQQDSPTGISPGQRSFAGCAWDPSVARLVLYGGQAATTSPTDGIFIYDPDDQVWEVPPLVDGSSNPGNRSDMGAGYSESLGGVLFFGGRTATTTYTNETWLIELGN